MGRITNKIKNLFKHKESLVGSLFAFIRTPDYMIKPNISPFWSKLWDMLRLWSLCVVITTPISFLIASTLESSGYDQSQHAVVALFRESTLLALVFMIFVWAPVTEEFTFRLGLRYSPYRLGFGLAFISIMLVSMLQSFGLDILHELIKAVAGFGPYAGIALFATLILVIGVIFGWSLNRCCKRSVIEKYYRKHFRAIIYASSLLFALVHLFNYLDIESILYLIPILALPQLLIGFALAYIRMRYNFVWSIFFHFLYNSLIAAPALLLSQVPDSLIDALNRGDTGVLEGASSHEILILNMVLLSPFVVLLVVLVSLASLVYEFMKKHKKN